MEHLDWQGKELMRENGIANYNHKINASTIFGYLTKSGTIQIFSSHSSYMNSLQWDHYL